MTNYLTIEQQEVRKWDNTRLGMALTHVDSTTDGKAHFAAPMRKAIKDEAARRLQWADVYAKHEPR